MPHIKGRQQREGPPRTQSANLQPLCLTCRPLFASCLGLFCLPFSDLCLEAGADWGHRDACSGSLEPTVE